MTEKIIDIDQWSQMDQKAVGIALAQKIEMEADWKWNLEGDYDPHRFGAILIGTSHEFGLRLRFCDYAVFPRHEYYQFTFWKDGEKYGARSLYRRELQVLRFACQKRLTESLNVRKQGPAYNAKLERDERSHEAEELLVALRKV